MNDFEILDAYSEIKKLKDAYSSTFYKKIELWIKNNLDSSYHQSFITSISKKQLESKKWLIAELSKVKISGSINVEIIGGWFGFPLLELLYNLYQSKIEKIDYYDIDKTCHRVLWQYLNYSNFPLKVNCFGDFFDRTDMRTRQLIINTSQEHMPYLDFSYHKRNPIVVLQSNNFFELDEHVNCVSTVDELIEKSKLKNIHYYGSKEFEKYTRFMVIGEANG